MDVWITYRLVAHDLPDGECEAGSDAQGDRRELFTFPTPDPPGFLMGETFVYHGPSIGQMNAAIRQRNGREGVVLSTEFTTKHVAPRRPGASDSTPGL
ncbi:hypothetical protein GCM10010140_52750 [Streptosporangium pseudovulgare]|uniref:Uncharacterized protein n=1 Tax=Streptosporangium pseudovulgare TaxID=35765 RepID=A0ABQ2R8S3_9ACTN|nr:hypothetical protein GCM10010140_52750 [Streptosporangium pseudovulgare]